MINPNEEYTEDEFLEDNQEEYIKGNKNKKLKLFLPLIILCGVIGLMSGYYYIMTLANEPQGTPVAEIPDPVDTTISGAEKLDQLALAEAQLKKEDAEAGLVETPVKDEELTRIDFSVKAKKNTEIHSTKEPINTTPIQNVEAPIKITRTKEKSSSVIRPVMGIKKRVDAQRSLDKLKVQQTVDNNVDPFNIVMGQKANKQKANINSQKSAEGSTYNDYIKQFEIDAQDEEPVPAVISGNHRITPGQTIAIRLKKEMKIKGELINNGALIYGLPTIDNGRINIKISNVKKGAKLVRANISVLGEDMNEGVQYTMKGTTDYSNTKGQIVDAATSSLGTVGSIISGLGRNANKSREPEYWLTDGKKIFLLIN